MVVWRRARDTAWQGQGRRQPQARIASLWGPRGRPLHFKLVLLRRLLKITPCCGGSRLQLGESFATPRFLGRNPEPGTRRAWCSGGGQARGGAADSVPPACYPRLPKEPPRQVYFARRTERARGGVVVSSGSGVGGESEDRRSPATLDALKSSEADTASGSGPLPWA